MAKKALDEKVAGGSSLMVNSVHKAFRVLSAFEGEEPQLTLTQIAAKLDIDKSTAQRFVHTLEALGYLEKNAVTKTLQLSVKVLDFAHVYLATSPFIRTAMPYLMHLNQQTGETVNLTVLDGTDVVFISRLVGNHLLSTGVGIGTRVPAYCSAAGVAIVSAMDDAGARRVLKASDLKAYTPETVHRLSEIEKRIAQTRARGYALGIAEYFSNDISLGVAVLDRSGQPVGAMSLAVSRGRLSAEKAEVDYAALLVAAARSVVL